MTPTVCHRNMIVDFSAEECFVLRVCAASYTPVSLLRLRPTELSQQWFRYQPPPCNRQSIDLALRKLIEGCLVEVHSSESGRPTIGITSDGARVWEMHYKPNWLNFMIWRVRNIEGDRVRLSVMCGSPRLRKEFLEKAPRCMRLNQDFGIRDIRIRETKDWEATYWKTLPVGYFASFQCRDDDTLEAVQLDQNECRHLLPWGRTLEDWSLPCNEGED